MTKEFNITGVCIPGKHYMVDISDKVADIMKLVERGKYFVINRPRQYGKTTSIYMLDRLLKNSEDYFPINISFEGIGQEGFESAPVFIKAFMLQLETLFEIPGNETLLKLLETGANLERMDELGKWINTLVKKTGKKTVLMIDEVDKSSNNQLFLDFLGMLRNKYLKRSEEGEFTFHSVILVGVHDVKTLKLKIRPDTEAKYNSPWNIAVNFKVDMTFSPREIASMLEQYATDRHVALDIPLFAEKLYYFTSGYPFLVSYLCKIIDEDILPGKSREEWELKDLEKAVQLALKEDNTNFESVITNLENNTELYDFVFNLIIEGGEFDYNLDQPVIRFGSIYGILKEENGIVRVHNRLYEQRIYNYMTSGIEIASGGTIGKYAISSVI